MISTEVEDYFKNNKPAGTGCGLAWRSPAGQLLIALFAHLAVFLGFHTAGVLAGLASLDGLVAAAAFFVFLVSAEGERGHGGNGEEGKQSLHRVVLWSFTDPSTKAPTPAGT